VRTGLLAAGTLDHVGIAASAGEFPLAALLGDPAPGLTPMPSGVGVARFGPERALELVVPLHSPTPVDRFLEARGPGLHHVALRVEEPLASLLPRLRESAVEVTGRIEASSDGRPSLFLHPSSTGGVLVELVEGARPS
jgi:hypothetical protein